jgi:hypothetical protein
MDKRLRTAKSGTPGAIKGLTVGVFIFVVVLVSLLRTGWQSLGWAFIAFGVWVGIGHAIGRAQSMEVDDVPRSILFQDDKVHYRHKPGTAQVYFYPPAVWNLIGIWAGTIILGIVILILAK